MCQINSRRRFLVVLRRRFAVGHKQRFKFSNELWRKTERTRKPNRRRFSTGCRKRHWQSPALSLITAYVHQQSEVSMLLEDARVSVDPAKTTKETNLHMNPPLAEEGGLEKTPRQMPQRVLLDPGTAIYAVTSSTHCLTLHQLTWTTSSRQGR